MRALLFARGGTLDNYDLVWLGEHDEVIRRVSADPGSANDGCGGVFAAACTQGKRDLVIRLLEAGARVPPVVTACRSYLWSEPATLSLLLAWGMSPDLPDWQLATPLHDLCGRDSRSRAPRIVSNAPLSCSMLVPTFRRRMKSTVRRRWVGLLARGAKTNLANDEPWATPLAWAARRGHSDIAEILRKASCSMALSDTSANSQVQKGPV